MKFVTIGDTHVNIEMISGFAHYDGHLYIYGARDLLRLLLDEDKSLYRKLCAACSVDAVTEEKKGE